MNAIDHSQFIAEQRRQRDRLRNELVARCGEARGEVFLAQLLGNPNGEIVPEEEAEYVI